MINPEGHATYVKLVKAAYDSVHRDFQKVIFAHIILQMHKAWTAFKQKYCAKVYSDFIAYLEAEWLDGFTKKNIFNITLVSCCILAMY